MSFYSLAASEYAQRSARGFSNRGRKNLRTVFREAARMLAPQVILPNELLLKR